MRGKMQPKMAARRDTLKLGKNVWTWLQSWPPAITPKPSNEPNATAEESELGWNHYMLEGACPRACSSDNGASWWAACLWFAIREGVMNGEIEVAPAQDHTLGRPFKNFAQCVGLCKTIPAPIEWRVWKYGENYKEHY
jgi:hypothetical protein